jgi:peptidoglycan/xylan/chitin deacetylase (PgdA/CDA1 family)
MPVSGVRDVLVVCYHGVSPDWTDTTAITAEQLEEQLELVLARGYRAATFTEAVRSPPARKTVAVTFDDAFRSVLDHAVPVLRRLGIPATMFVPTAYVGDGGLAVWPTLDRYLGGPFEQELRLLTWAELSGLAGEGWEIGSHTCTHPHLRRVDDGVLARELVESRRECEDRLGRPCRSFAYPYGDVDARVVRAVKQAGYEAAAQLSLPRWATRLEWPRVAVDHQETPESFERKIALGPRRLARSRAGMTFMRQRRRTRLALERRVKLARHAVRGRTRA